MEFIYDNIVTTKNVKKNILGSSLEDKISSVTLIKLHFSHLSFISAGKWSNINSLPLLHYHQSISSSIQDPNPKQGKIFLRLKTCFLLILFLALHEIVLTLGTLQNGLNNASMNLR